MMEIAGGGWLSEVGWNHWKGSAIMILYNKRKTVGEWGEITVTRCRQALLLGIWSECVSTGLFSMLVELTIAHISSNQVTSHEVWVAQERFCLNLTCKGAK